MGRHGRREQVPLRRGAPVILCLRPEEVVLRNGQEHPGNHIAVQVGAMEFIGNNFATTLHAVRTSLNFSADLSTNDVRDLGIAPSGTIWMAIPTDRLRVFAQPPPRLDRGGPHGHPNLGDSRPLGRGRRPTEAAARPRRLHHARRPRDASAAARAHRAAAVVGPAVEKPSGGRWRFRRPRQFPGVLANSALANSIGNSILISVVSTAVCVLLAFGYAYGITRTCMPGRGLFKTIAHIPILAPSLLPAIGLVYLFGNQGLAKGLLFGASIYGPIGIVIGVVFCTFPHAPIIITTALALADAGLHEPPRRCESAPTGPSGR
jgi:ABC-type glycerol-3-phosphate transport system permease component